MRCILGCLKYKKDFFASADVMCVIPTPIGYAGATNRCKYFVGRHSLQLEKRKDGARRMRGNAKAAAGDLVEYEGSAGGDSLKIG